ncbi:MAG: PIN/TRAM domain-containing protein, partial [Nocardioidaceae bacterium]
ALFLSTVVGAAVGYVIGGTIGRRLLAVVGAVERSTDRISGAELVAGVAGFFTGAVGAVIVALAIVLLIPFHLLAYPAAALVFVVLAFAGYRVSARKRFELLAMMGLSQSRNFSAPISQTAAGPRVLDTSVIIDGRIVDVARSGFLAGHLICPRFVLAELQSISDSPDAMRRARGRRGLDVLDRLQGDPRIRLEVADDPVAEVADVDGKLVEFTKRVGGVLVTNDFDLHRTAEVQGVPVLNVNALADALRPVVLPGEELSVRIVREGRQSGQGVGYLEDGTMVVVEGARGLIGTQVETVVTSVLQTSGGRMVFSTAQLAESGSGSGA